nr:calcium-binding protein [Ensifer sp. BR816]
MDDFTSSELFTSFAAMIDEQLGLRIPDITLGIENLTGSGHKDDLTGNAGANVLDGGKGKDRLVGGLGHDTYMFDGADTIVEAANQGTDTVKSTVSYTLAANLENLTLAGTAAINGTGNSVANVLTGNSAANALNGGTGADRLVGGVGNDTYITDGGDTIGEAANQGTDTVKSSASHTLASNVENLTLTGTAAINGSGNNLANTLSGNSANNVLNGAVGADRMTDGLGKDTFVFKSTSDSTVATSGRDTIFDFSASAGDKIDLSSIDANTGISGNQTFSFLGTGAFTGKAGQLRYDKATSDTYIYADVNGDKKADFASTSTTLSPSRKSISCFEVSDEKNTMNTMEKLSLFLFQHVSSGLGARERLRKSLLPAGSDWVRNLPTRPDQTASRRLYHREYTEKAGVYRQAHLRRSVQRQRDGRA